MGKLTSIIACCAVTIIAIPAHANLISNGDFSVNPPGSGCAAGVTSLPSWTVASGNVDIISDVCNNPVAPAGNTYYLDLTGSFAEYGVNDVGTIAQTFATNTGSRYNVSFYFGGNSEWQVTPYPNDSPIKSMNALINGNVAGTYSVNTTGVSSLDAQWQLENFSFLATSANTTLSFQSLNGVTQPSDYGPFLADVQVNSVPEPTSIALFGIGILAIPFVAKRKTKHFSR